MCGICGFAGEKNEGLLRAMTAALQHRGPDEDGFYQEEGRVALGMRRLRVIDLATGSQPVFNEDRTVCVVFNGEIYNYRELRRELEGRGHRFATASDTEALVHLYEEHGEEFPRLLRGMFAFALWDARRRTLLLGRDQFGVKPLYYAEAGGRLYFGSELKALLPVPGLADELDPAALDAYFTLLYIPAPLSAYRGIRKLEPASVLAFRDGRAGLKKYWELKPRGGVPAGEPELLAEIDRLLGASVKEQLVSDVPLGLLLSGGVDSGSLLHYMAGAGGPPVKTFTVGYRGADKDFDETAGARLLAGRFGAEHTEAVLEPDAAGLMGLLAERFDEPFADAAALPTWLVTREARRKVTVALTGLGGDELFGGYPRHLGARLLPAYLRLPAAARAALWRAASVFPESSSPFNLPGRAKRFLRGGLSDFGSAYASWLTCFDRGERAALYSEQLKRAGVPAAAAAPGPSGPDEVFPYEARGYLADDLLCLADRASMANSLELRVPFLDVRLAELLAAVPLSRKTAGFTLKRLLKRLMAGRLPARTLGGPKRGFQVPLARWHGGRLKEFLAETLSPAAVSRGGFLDPGAVSRLLADHAAGRRNLGDQVYAAAMFQLWLASLKRRPGVFSSGGISLRRPLSLLVCTDIIQADDEGGSGRVAWEAAVRLAAAGHRVTVLTRGARGRQERETVSGVLVLRHFSSPLKIFSLVKGLIKEQGRPDALYVHHPYTGLLARLAAGPVPAVYSFHSPWGLEFDMRAADQGYSLPRRVLGAWLRRRLERAALSFSGNVHAASRFMAGKLRDEHGLEPSIVPLGVDLERFRPAADREGLRRRLGLPEEAFVLLTVRNLVGRMGLENLVEAAALPALKGRDTVVVIGGRGYLRARLEALIEERGLAGKVRLAGFIPDSELPAYYQCADLFVLPTRALEGFGLVTLEALACGTPVLATPVAANPEVLGPLDPGLLLAGGSPEDIAAGVEAFVARYGRGGPELRARCRAYAENFSWDKFAAREEEAFYSAAGASR